MEQNGFIEPLLTRSIPKAATKCSRPAFISIPKLASLQPESSNVNSSRQYATVSDLKVSADRLWDDIHFTAQWGTGTRYGSDELQTGMSRLSLSDSDKSVRDWFAETTASLGCSLTIDEMGNMFAVRKGKKEGAPTYAGSHLDTQPTGGRFDGILGVTSGVEMLRVLNDSKFETEYPVGVVNWTNEEGARFPKSMVSSGVWAQDIPLQTAHNLKSVVRGQEATMKAELERIGYLGKIPCSFEAMPMAAHFELHIEQGPILENESRKVGIVRGVQAYKWFTITVTGRDSHTGTTDISSRADALLAASQMIVAAREEAIVGGGLASIGIIEAKPGSTNTIPGIVTFSLDVRAKTDDVLESLVSALQTRFDGIAKGEKEPPLSDVVKVEWQTDFHSPAVHFHDDCIQCVSEGAKSIFGDHMDQLTKDMRSGAGHDSVYTSKRFPTSMIFVPSRAGISHHPAEWTSKEDCSIGAQVLMQAVLRYDQLREAQA